MSNDPRSALRQVVDTLGFIAGATVLMCVYGLYVDPWLDSHIVGETIVFAGIGLGALLLFALCTLLLAFVFAALIKAQFGK